MVGKIGKREVDFVCEKGEERLYIQVAYLITDDKVKKREFGNLLWPFLIISLKLSYQWTRWQAAAIRASSICTSKISSYLSLKPRSKGGVYFRVELTFTPSEIVVFRQYPPLGPSDMRWVPGNQHPYHDPFHAY